MHNKIILVAFFLFLAINIYSEKIQNSITIEHLINNTWGPEYSIGVKVLFQLKDGKTQYYDANAHYGHYGDINAGSFTIKENQLYLYAEGSQELYLKGGRLFDDATAVKYQQFIEFDDGTIIYNKNSTVAEGMERTIDGFDAVIIGNNEAGLTSNMKFRKTPGTNGEIIKIWYGSPDDEKLLTYVPKEVTIKVIARTKEKARVEDWNNYWYYVEVPDSYGWSYQKGWMFGEFIIIK